MFGYMKKSQVLKIITHTQGQLNDKETETFMLIDEHFSEKEKNHWLESINKLKGGIIHLENLKKHFR